MEHMQKDLQSISTLLEKSKEDVLILMHYLLSEIMNNQTAARYGQNVDDAICFLKDKRSRAIWEEEFNKLYILPVLEKSEEIIGQVTQQVLSDQRFAAGGENIESYWKDYKEVWGYIQQSLDGYGFPVNGTIVYLSKENCNRKMDDKTSLSYILPAKTEDGLCSFAVLFFLLEKQNLFLQKYCIESKIKYDRLPRVHIRDISAAHLISYHPERDLLPMVLANCSYSFEVGQGTKVEYNFNSLEKQLIDRLLFTKSVILVKEIATVIYRSENTNAVVFINLRDKIRQERVSPAVFDQIKKDVHIKKLPELCDSIDHLDIAISFLRSVAFDPESLLSDFMINILKLEGPVVSQTVRYKTSSS
ncbi:Hypothetical predicted protein [Mytilus galloprovincialis]|uniref:Uncharacterized protein n=1 Tax=Mytilus galloprovincialis TaxID=29158 RepID=A0A8B6DS25_MYTGA|nr:Hypothetical predicted protein [Mytilus galloprovincialis]